MILFLIIIFVVLSINLYLHRKRIVVINKLHSLYDKLETAIIVKRLRPDNKLITFLKINKAPIFNNHMLDFSFIFLAFKEIENEKEYEKSKKGFESYKETLPLEVQKISDEINQLQNKIISLSLLKPVNFIVFVLLLLPAIIISLVLYKIFKSFGFVYSKLMELPLAVKEAYTNENVIVSYPEIKLHF